jgi:tetratricopeptide (TPR) repeat protein
MRAAHKDLARQAPAALGEAVRYLARDVPSHIAAGDRALARDDYATAVECFYRAVDREPENLDALQGLAVALAASERFEEALPIYKMVIALAGDDAAAGVRHPGVTARFNLAVAYSRLKRFRDAIETYRELVRDREDYVQAWYNLAGIYQAEGKLLEARDAWRQVVKLNPQYVNAYSQLGEVLIDLGAPGEAVKAYAEAARLSPDAAAWSNLAGAAHAAGNLGQAAVALKRALDCDSRDASLWMRLGDVLLGMHRTAGDPKLLKEAVDAWRESLRLNPDQKKVQELIRTYERALTSRPSTAPTQPK